MSRRPQSLPLGVLALGLIVVLLLSAPSGAVASSHSSAVGSTTRPSSPSPGLPARSASDAAPTVAGPYDPLGPYNGVLFNSSSSLPTGDDNAALGIAIDAATGVVYAANYLAGTVSAFDANNGTVVGAVTITNPVNDSFLRGIVLDTEDDTLFVLVDNTTASGYVAVVTVPELQVVANISFAGYLFHRFEPTFGSYDPTGDTVFVENETGAQVIVISGATNEWIGLDSGFGCSSATLSHCASAGLVPVSTLNILVVPTGLNQVLFFNASTERLLQNVSIPAPVASAFGVFDPLANVVYLDSYNATKPTELLKFSISTATASFAGFVHTDPAPPPNVTAMAYDPLSNTLLIADANHTTELFAYNATTGNSTGNFTGAPLFPVTNDRAFFTLAIDNASDVAIASGGENDTTFAFSLRHSFREIFTYSSFPELEDLIAVDQTSHLLLVRGSHPNLVEGINATTGTLAWVDYLAALVTDRHAAFDNVTNVLYLIPNGTGPAVLDVIAAGTGSEEAPIPLVGGPPADQVAAIGLDDVHTILYVSLDNRTIQFFNLVSGVRAGGVSTPAQIACTFAVNATAYLAYFANCGVLGTVETVYPQNHSLGASWAVGSDPYALATDNGRIYVASALAGNVSVINPDATALNGSVHLNLTVPSSVAVDPTNDLLFITSALSRESQVADLSGYLNHSYPVIGTFKEPSSVNTTEWDPQSSSFVGAEITTGEMFTATEVVAPSSPQDLELNATNATIAVSWTGPAWTGGAPVVAYEVSVMSNLSPPIDSSVTGLSTRLTNLADGVFYTVSVVAENPTGTGPATTANATPYGVPYPPTDLTVLGITNTSIDVGWHAPQITGGAANLSYSLLWEPAGTVDWTEVGVNGLESYNLTKLSPSSNYVLEVEAQSDYGNSNPSTPVTVATLAQHSPPPPAENKTKAGTTGLTRGDWLGILALAAAVVIIAGVILWSRKPEAPPPTPPAATGLSAPAPPPATDAPAPWDEGSS
ncbi:MAG: fibronectin type III domain-containing protein [Thermoplasmata archaeon]